MKKILGLAVVLVLLYAVLLSAIPTSAVTTGPFNYDKGVIQNISSPSTKSLGGKQGDHAAENV